MKTANPWILCLGVLGLNLSLGAAADIRVPVGPGPMPTPTPVIVGPGMPGVIPPHMDAGDIEIVDHQEVGAPGDDRVVLMPGERPAQFMRAASTSVSDYRCEHDSLDPDTSRQRLIWAAANNIIPQSLAAKWLYTVEGDKVVMNARPYYPMFGTWNGRLQDSVIWKPEANNYPTRVPNGKVWIAVCRASCYTPGQAILTDQGYKTIGSAERQQYPALLSLSQNASFDKLSYRSSRVERYTASIVDTKHKILRFQLASGGKLEVTENHPLVNQEGRLVEASELRSGEALVSAQGELDTIERIDRLEYYGKVYNVRPISKNPLHNIIVAQGYLSGSELFQNEYYDLIQDQVLSSQIRSDLLP